MKLELGAGARPTPGYTHQDVRQLPGIDIVCDARQLPEGIKGKLEEIYAYHMLEHIPWREVERAVQHWADWLAPGGLLRTISPDFLSLAQWLVKYPDNDYIVDRVQYMMFGSQTYPDSAGAFESTNVHTCLTVQNSVRRWMTKAGLSVVENRRHNNRPEEQWGQHCPMLTVVGRKNV
jgi:predicted SAM-dependent methyltransferase